MSTKLNSITKPCKRLLRSSGGSTAGRNSSGRITIFHRGGGAKRLHRNVDVKRNTESIGIVERIEYDPNRSSRLALVRWIEGVKPSSKSRKTGSKVGYVSLKTLEPVTVTPAGRYYLSRLSCNTGQRDGTNLVPGQKETSLVVGLPNGSSLPSKSAITDSNAGSRISSMKDVFLSAFAPPKAKGESVTFSSSGSMTLPRIALAGARPTFYAALIGDENQGLKDIPLSEIRKWKKDSSTWNHKLKRKAAVSWQSFCRPGFENNGLKLLTNQGSISPKLRVREAKSGEAKTDCAPVSYIIASHGLEPGKMVRNCERSNVSRY